MGFLGSHLTRRLLADGHTVVAVDNGLTGRADNLPAPADGTLQVVRCDVADLVGITGPIDRVYHLASPASPVAWGAHPLATLDAGSAGTRSLLELAQRNGARLLMASTSEVYGDPEVHPQPESYRGNVDPTGPRSAYDEAKRFSEALCTAFAASRGTEVRIARIFNTYGPRMAVHDGRVVPNFVGQALNDRPITVHGDGTQTRSFCYVDDLIEGLVRLMESHVEGPCNIGHDREITMIELARRIRLAVGSDSEIVHIDRPLDDPARRCPDIARARRTLGWEPRVSLEAGLQATIAWYRDRI